MPAVAETVRKGAFVRASIALVLAFCITWPLRRPWIFRPVAPGGSSSAVTSTGPKPPVPSKFLPVTVQNSSRKPFYRFTLS